MEKLISMTDFVLLDKYAGSPINMNKQYANLLKQTLKLGMFVPCDEKGNVLEEPTPEDILYDDNIYGQYQQAKARVLFEGFKYVNNRHVYNGFITFNKESILGKTIEDLITYNLTLIEK